MIPAPGSGAVIFSVSVCRPARIFAAAPAAVAYDA